LSTLTAELAVTVMGRQLLSSYRYTPIEPVSTSPTENDTPDLAVHPAAYVAQPARNNITPHAEETAVPPPKYSAPSDLPDYQDVAATSQPLSIFRITTSVSRDDDIPFGNACTFIMHAMLVAIFGIFGFFMSWCVGIPSYARRFGRAFGVGLDICKTALYLKYYNAIMCSFERVVLNDYLDSNDMNNITGFIETGSDGMEIITIDGTTINNFCSLPPTTDDPNNVFTFMLLLALFLMLVTLYQAAVVYHRLKCGGAINV